MLYSEFRDGNVPAGHEQLRVLKDCLPHLPDSVKKVSLRSDTAEYQESKLQNYFKFFLSRAEISRIRPSVFKCQVLKYFVSF